MSNGPEFFQTGMGRKFYENDVPELIRSLNRIGDKLDELIELEKRRDLVEEPMCDRSTNLLTEAFKGLANLPHPVLNTTTPDNQREEGDE